MRRKAARQAEEGTDTRELGRHLEGLDHVGLDQHSTGLGCLLPSLHFTRPSRFLSTQQWAFHKAAFEAFLVLFAGFRLLGFGLPCGAHKEGRKVGEGPSLALQGTPSSSRELAISEGTAPRHESPTPVISLTYTRAWLRGRQLRGFEGLAGITPGWSTRWGMARLG